VTEAVIQTEKLTRRLAGEITVTLVEDATLAVHEGEFVAITGASGSGKSSLLYLLGLLDRPTSGQIWLRGDQTFTLGEDALAGLRLAEIGFVFQFHFLLPEFSALENVMLPMQRLGRFLQPEFAARAAELLGSLGLAADVNKLPRQLSGGQSQRVAIARALANDPLLILADEPTGNLDTVASANVQRILIDLARDYGRAVVVVTHDRDFAAAADRVIVMSDGRIQRGVNAGG
jgi:lipoprotein-releasing system ATP-binding protein